MRNAQFKVMPVKRTILVVFIALMAVGVVLTTNKITTLSERLTNSQSKLVWYMLSLSKEYDALITLLERYQGGKSGFDPLAIQYEILWSRFPVAITMANSGEADQSHPTVLLKTMFADLKAHESRFYALRYSSEAIGSQIAHYRQQRQLLDGFFQQSLSMPGNGYREHTRLLNQLGQLTTVMTLGMIAVGATVLILIAMEAKRYYRLAREDQLTGLHNRHWLFDTLNGRYTFNTDDMAILVIDLDGFKAINDNYGHDVGDLFLSVLADKLVAGLPQYAVIARLGGDEFAVVMPYQHKNDPIETANTLVDVAHQPININESPCQVSASIGIAYGQDKLSGERLLTHADTAMYAAKRAGKNQYRVYHNTMQPPNEKQHSRAGPRFDEATYWVSDHHQGDGEQASPNS
ncbi:diguanylate cyclase (GGDEF) domain-containing protein [Salinivibrio sp. ES.052]|nr:diguanylate cyclase (GGDEF) domain-containing protein [Salinivibrio sp. ES.052]